jgi:hypothetical protein
MGRMRGGGDEGRRGGKKSSMSVRLINTKHAQYTYSAHTYTYICLLSSLSVPSTSIFQTCTRRRDRHYDGDDGERVSVDLRRKKRQRMTQWT